MKKTNLIPKSKAKNAYELLNEVKALILGEPKRYQQSMWIRRISKGDRRDEFPACGTVACVGGWVATLKRKAVDEVTAGDVAMDILGLDETKAYELFNAFALVECIPRGRPYPEPQSVAYAKLGAKHITRFQKKYAQQLKAKAV